MLYSEPEKFSKNVIIIGYSENWRGLYSFEINRLKVWNEVFPSSFYMVLWLGRYIPQLALRVGLCYHVVSLDSGVSMGNSEMLLRVPLWRTSIPFREEW